MTHHLVLGGARSGKSSFAERHCLAQQSNPIYIATAEAGDQEMTARIAHHQQQRGSNWQLIEEPLELAGKIIAIDQNETQASILIDCLTLWLSNCLHAECWPEAKAELIEAIEHCRHPITMVSNEVGNGIVPMHELSRRFVDEAGRLHQELASICSSVTLLVAGIPQYIKR